MDALVSLNNTSAEEGGSSVVHTNDPQTTAVPGLPMCSYTTYPGETDGGGVFKRAAHNPVQMLLLAAAIVATCVVLEMTDTPPDVPDRRLTQVGVTILYAGVVIATAEVARHRRFKRRWEGRVE